MCKQAGIEDLKNVWVRRDANEEERATVKELVKVAKEKTPKIARRKGKVLQESHRLVAEEVVLMEGGS